MARDMCLPSTAVSITFWIISVLPLPFSIIIISYGCKQSSKLKMRCLQCVYILTLLLLFIAQVIFPLHLYFDHSFSGICTDLTRVYITSTILNSSYFGSLFFIDIVYALRLYVFKNTIYRPLKIQSIIISIALFTQFAALVCVLCFSRLYWGAFWNNDPSNTAKYLNFMGISVNVFLISHLFDNVLLLFMFIHNAHRICANAKHMIEPQQTIPFEIRKVIEMTSRYTLCLMLTFATTSIFCVVYFMRTLGYLEWTNTAYVSSLAYTAWDILFNLVSIILQFDSDLINRIFNNLCGCCKRRMENVMTNKLLQTIQPGVSRKRSISGRASTNNCEPTHSTTTNATTGTTIETIGSNDTIEITEMAQLKEI